MSERVSVRVPATCANLGCLFDCGAIALSLYANIHVTLRGDDETVVRYKGIHADRVCSGPKNLIARTLQETLRGWGKTRGFELEIENQIPVGVGVGSSAAAIVGALAAGHVLADRAMFDEELVSLAAQREGHPDNVAAAWHGGFTVAAQTAGIGSGSAGLRFADRRSSQGAARPVFPQGCHPQPAARGNADRTAFFRPRGASSRLLR
jgi:homoserine kinase